MGRRVVRFGGITELRILVSLRMITVVYATSFTRQNTFKSALEEIKMKQTLVVPFVMLDFRRSLESGLLARVPSINQSINQ